MRAGWGVRVAEVTVAVQLKKESDRVVMVCFSKKKKKTEFSNTEKQLVPGEQEVP